MTDSQGRVEDVNGQKCVKKCDQNCLIHNKIGSHKQKAVVGKTDILRAYALLIADG